MNRLPPELPDTPCGGYEKATERALHAVAKSIELAVDLRMSLDELTRSANPPIAPHRRGFDLAAWKTLAAYLIEERRLTEFLLGPNVDRSRGGGWRYHYTDDVCLDCFTPADRRWRFTNETVRVQLCDRAERINKRLTHFSWKLTESDPRSDTGRCQGF